MKMRDYILRRLLLLIPVMFGVTLITFFLSHVIPADPAAAWAGGPKASETAIENIREAYHLNDPLYVQYLIYLKGILKGDLGYSPVTHRPVLKELKDYFPATMELTIFSMLLAIVIGIPTGVISAVKKDKPMDHFTRIFALLGVSIPIFWLGLLLQLTFYFKLGWLPDPGGRVNDFVIMKYPLKKITKLYLVDSLIAGNWPIFVDTLKHLIMPAIALSYASTAIITRMTRSSMLEVLGQDYIRTARAGGLSERVVIYKHALRNALIPTTTVIGLSFAGLLGGAVLTETVFYWPGMGRYVVNALTTLDFPTIMGFVVIIAVIFVTANLIVDIIYAFLDPRIRYG
ncbi:MAG: ABC transporter permease [Candidatus Methanofastidiosia archaeon]